MKASEASVKAVPDGIRPSMAAVREMLRRGMDTVEIAAELRVPEAGVYNLLPAAARETGRPS